MTATLTWTGTNPAPKTVNVILNVGASATGYTATTVNNGYDDDIVVNNATKTRTGKHLKTLGVSGGVATVTYSLSAIASSPPGAVCTVGVDGTVSIDPRSAYIHLEGHYTNYKKQLSVILKTLPVALSNGTTKIISWYEAVPVINEQISNPSDPLTGSGTLYVGLPVQKQSVIWSGSQGTEIVPLTLPKAGLTFGGNVYQNLVENEWYEWSSDQGGFSSDLPTWSTGWDIKLQNQSYVTPSILNNYITYTTSQDKGAINTGGYVRLKYKWADGLRAETKWNIEFHPGTEYQSVLDEYLDFAPEHPWAPVPFDVPWVPAGHASHPVVIAPRNWTLYWATTSFALIVAALGAMDPPVGLYWSVAAAAYGIALAENPNQDTTTPFPAGGMSEFNAAAAEGRVSPSNWQDYFPANNFSLSSFQWKTDFRPLVQHKWILSDLWTLDGYAGQRVAVAKTPQPMMASARRYYFKLPQEPPIVP